MLKNKLPPFMGIHKASHFLQDGAPCHKNKKVMDWFKEQNIEVMDWPGNSPDLNPIKNVWSYMKKKVKDKAITSVPVLQQEILKLWTMEISQDYFKKLTNSMLVLERRGEMTKY